MAQASMETGTVKWFNKDKGYGFIVPDTLGEDVFLHAVVLRKSGFETLPEGSRVRYTTRLSPSSGRTQAQHLELIRAEAVQEVA